MLGKSWFDSSVAFLLGSISYVIFAMFPMFGHTGCCVCFSGIIGWCPHQYQFLAVLAFRSQVNITMFVGSFPQAWWCIFPSLVGSVTKFSWLCRVVRGCPPYTEVTWSNPTMLPHIPQCEEHSNLVRTPDDATLIPQQMGRCGKCMRAWWELGS